MVRRADLTFKTSRDARAFLVREAYGCGVVIDGTNGREVMLCVSARETSLLTSEKFVADYGQKEQGLTVVYTKNGKRVRRSIANLLLVKVWSHLNRIVNTPHLPSEVTTTIDGELNIFPGYAVAPVSQEEFHARKGELEAWLEHTDKIICADNPTVQRWMRAYVACLLGLPRERCKRLLILHGVQDSGKSAWLAPIQKALGSRLAFEVDSPNDLFKRRFTARMTVPRLVVVNGLEALTTERYPKLRNRLKRRTTYVQETHLVDNYAMYIGCTTEENVAGVLSSDHTVTIDVSSAATKKPTSYWEAVANVDPSLVLTWALNTVEEIGEASVLQTLRDSITPVVDVEGDPTSDEAVTSPDPAVVDLPASPSEFEAAADDYLDADAASNDEPSTISTVHRFLWELKHLDGFVFGIRQERRGEGDVFKPLGRPIVHSSSHTVCQVIFVKKRTGLWSQTYDLYLAYRAWCRRKKYALVTTYGYFVKVTRANCDTRRIGNESYQGVDQIEMKELANVRLADPISCCLQQMINHQVGAQTNLRELFLKYAAWCVDNNQSREGPAMFIATIKDDSRYKVVECDGIPTLQDYTADTHSW
jgi:hypothetical protein